jgi:GyrI-like small molecule binding domain
MSVGPFTEASMRNLVTTLIKARQDYAAPLASGRFHWFSPCKVMFARLAVILLALTPAQAQSPLPPASAIPAPTIPAPSVPPAVPTPPIGSPDTSKPGSEIAAREITARPALRLRAQSTWDQGFAAIRKSIDLLVVEASRLGLLRDSNPLAHFVDSDDLGFTYEALLPLVMPPAHGAALPHGIEAGSTPAGRGLSFPHEGAYDELDAAYEAITALLDEKGFVATGQFIEEYILLPEKSDDPNLRMNVLVFLR